MIAATFADEEGSSPQAWGKLAPDLPLGVGLGIIPTGVGKAPSHGARAPSAWDHPHRRGESTSRWPSNTSPVGSSPQAWGKPGHPPEEPLVAGIIPTGVGKARLPEGYALRPRDHPHRRGESVTSALTSWDSPGSSPQAWGKPGSSAHAGRRPGIIPTGVGKARSPCTGSRRATDHPHRRGESGVVLAQRCCLAGSSPQAWGKPERDGADRLHSGIIPTGVGKASATAPARPAGRDHPHRRGESVGGIPTHARPRDHPHRRGESLGGDRAGGDELGSSPQAWGKPAEKQAALEAAGIIPTGVGKAS